MSISVVKPNNSVTEMMRAQLAGMAERRTFRTRGLAAAPPQAMQLSIPHPIFNLDLDDIQKAGNLERATMTGWRYLVSSGNDVVAAVEASAKHQKDDAVFSHTNEGVFVRSCAQLLGEADSWPEMRAGQYVIGLLRVPSLYFMALWFRDAQGRGEHDVLVPLEPAPPGMLAGQRLGRDELVAALVSLKQGRRRSVDDSN